MNQPSTDYSDYPDQEFHIAVSGGMANIDFPYYLSEADWRKITAVLDIVKPEGASDNNEATPIIHSKHTLGSQRTGYLFVQYKLDCGVVDAYFPKKITEPDLDAFVRFLNSLREPWFGSPSDAVIQKRRGRPPKVKTLEPPPQSTKSFEETKVPPNDNIACLRPNIPFISSKSCTEWQHRWHTSKLAPSKAWDKLRPCRECEHKDMEDNRE